MDPHTQPSEVPDTEQPGIPSTVLLMIQREVDPTMNTTEEELGAKLSEFLELDLKYSLARTKKSEIDSLFFWTDDGPIGPTVPDMSRTKHKGGIHISPELRFGSVKLHKDESAGASQHLTKHWTCTSCKNSYYFNLDEMVEHKKSCEAENVPDDKVPL